MHADVQRYLDLMARDTAKAGRVRVWPAGHSTPEVAAKIASVIDPKAEVLLWRSNGRSPMADMLAAWLFLGVISEAQADATMAAGEEQTREFLAAYRAAQPAEPSDEQRYEARAALGEGVEVVDVITGRKFTT